MIDRRWRVLWWLLPAATAFVALAGFAAFTPAVLLVPLLSARAAWAARAGAPASGGATLALCALALWMSPLRADQAPWLYALTAAGALAFAACATRRHRSPAQRH